MLRSQSLEVESSRVQATSWPCLPRTPEIPAGEPGELQHPRNFELQRPGLFEVAPGVNSGFQPPSIRHIHNAEDSKDTTAFCGTHKVPAGTGLHTPAHGRLPSSSSDNNSDVPPATTRVFDDITKAVPQLREVGRKDYPRRRESSQSRGSNTRDRSRTATAATTRSSRAAPRGL